MFHWDVPQLGCLPFFADLTEIAELFRANIDENQSQEWGD